MSASIDEKGSNDGAASARSTCPGWCVSRHGLHLGEEDWVHAGAPLPVEDAVAAHACMSVDPDTGEVDGPYVIIGRSQYSPAEAEALGAALIALARAARSTTPLATA
jgi:hypothetical protein